MNIHYLPLIIDETTNRCLLENLEMSVFLLLFQIIYFTIGVVWVYFGCGHQVTSLAMPLICYSLLSCTSTFQLTGMYANSLPHHKKKKKEIICISN